MDDASAPPLIAIVEDDEFAAFLFKQALTSHGYAVVVSSGGGASLEALLARPPAALLVDLHLGDEDGVELLRQLRARRALRHVPAAVITGDYFTDARVSHELESLGVEMYLKPLWEDDLLRVVAGLLKRPMEPVAQTPSEREHPPARLNDALR